MSEHAEQAAVFEWASLMSNRYPELQVLHATPNAGKRSYGAAAHMKAEGMRAGLPDIHLPIAGRIVEHGITCDWYIGLWIEMKHGKNKPTPEQNWWIEKLRNNNSRVEVCYSADEAIAVIKDYLGISDD